MSVSKNLEELLAKIKEKAIQAGRDPEEISLVAVSKEQNEEKIKEAYFAGIRDFGENRVQDFISKCRLLPSDIRWHFIGKLQKNKISKILGCFALIHSIDTPDLAEKIAAASSKKGITTNILLEANTSGERAKSGLSPQEWEDAFLQLLNLKGIEIHGLMTMAPLTEDEGIIRKTFSELRSLRDRLQEMGRERVSLSTLSMGMTNDYTIAIQEGATLLRIGTAIFTPQ